MQILVKDFFLNLCFYYLEEFSVKTICFPQILPLVILCKFGSTLLHSTVVSALIFQLHTLVSSPGRDNTILKAQETFAGVLS